MKLITGGFIVAIGLVSGWALGLRRGWFFRGQTDSDSPASPPAPVPFAAPAAAATATVDPRFAALEAELSGLQS